jgi:glyoxylase-like metal-dependent hydrolase (beta-lactamase superfamily II)
LGSGLRCEGQDPRDDKDNEDVLHGSATICAWPCKRKDEGLCERGGKETAIVLRRALKVILLLLVAGVLALGVGLAWAHVAIRRERAPLPSPTALLAGGNDADGPTRVSVINTASQPMPRSAVLDSSRDPEPTAPFVMSHPAFVLEWADGRILLVDSGMSRAAAISFGRPLETFAGADPIFPHESVAEHLGAAASRVQAVIFTHLHTDHVDGIGELCAAAARPIEVFMTEAQAERPNYTTRPGLRLIDDATCAGPTRLSGASPFAVPGFPGVSVIDAGGHTPGSQIIMATVGQGTAARRYAFCGDTVNHLAGVTRDIPKPTLYRWLIVPEDETRQGELRRFLRQLHDPHGVIVLPAHDLLAIGASGLKSWTP